VVRVPSSRRTVLGAALAAPFAGWARADSSVGAGIPLVPGYEPDAAYLRGRPLRADAVAARALPAGYDGIVTMVSRVDTRGGETRRALMPISGHAIAVAPGGADALWVGMNDPVLLRFATETLDVLGMALPHAEGYVFGGHAVYAIDRGVAFVAERRDPGLRFTGSPEDHTGRIAVRDPDSLAVLDVWNGHGIAPHDLTLTADGRYLVIANYGSTAWPEGQGTPAPGIGYGVEPCVTVLDTADGTLVAKLPGTRRIHEVRHVAAHRLDRIVSACRCASPRSTMPNGVWRTSMSSTTSIIRNGNRWAT